MLGDFLETAQAASPSAGPLLISPPWPAINVSGASFWLVFYQEAKPYKLKVLVEKLRDEEWGTKKCGQRGRTPKYEIEWPTPSILIEECGDIHDK
jgi:hypothetical protein